MNNYLAKKYIKNLFGYSFYPFNQFLLNKKKNINRTLIFHSIDEKLIFDTYGFSVNFKDFKNYIYYLKFNNYEFHDFKSKITSKKSISITFDDGYKNILPAVDYLIELDIPAIIFVITSKINDNLYLSSGDINRLSNNKLITIGSHSHSHPNFAKLNNLNCIYEIETSIKIIEDIIGDEINTFAFPYGAYNLNNIKILNKFNINNICTSDYGYNINFENTIKRIEIVEQDNIESFKRKINGFYDYMLIKKILK